MRILNIANGKRLEQIWNDDFVSALSNLGELSLFEHGKELGEDEVAERLREHEVAIVGWDARPLPTAIAANHGALRYICCYSGTIRTQVPRDLIEAGIMVSNWGDHPATGVAEAAMTLLLAVIKDIPKAIDVARSGKWGIDTKWRGTLAGTRVGIYGCGVIGRRFVELLQPFGAEIRILDPHATTLPSGCDRVEDLDALFEGIEVLVIHAGLSDATTGAIRAEHLARLPDGGVVINTARGAIFDQEALFDELRSGRLRAGLDVLEPDFLPSEHELLGLDNCLLGFHQLDQLRWPPRPGLTPMQQICVDNIARFVAGEKPLWLFDVPRYDRST
jgi:phosphoglycerate dehydrogenase-like enzyme